MNWNFLRLILIQLSNNSKNLSYTLPLSTNIRTFYVYGWPQNMKILCDYFVSTTHFIQYLQFSNSRIETTLYSCMGEHLYLFVSNNFPLRLQSVTQCIAYASARLLHTTTECFSNESPMSVLYPQFKNSNAWLEVVQGLSWQAKYKNVM